MKKHESGRSMVEMLGVLAIIGVLSVGGIAGYSLSMRRHRANGIADIASKYALAIYGQCQKRILDGEVSSTGDCSLSMLPSFENAGVGPLPVGVTSFTSIDLLVDENGVDVVSFGVKFSDKKLCQAVGSITGTGCSSDMSFFKIKQN